MLTGVYDLSPVTKVIRSRISGYLKPNPSRKGNFMNGVMSAVINTQSVIIHMMPYM